MTTITTRAGKGSALTHAEVDTNFINLQATADAAVPSTGGVISANSSSNALRITQTGGGNALVVEDSTNPDSTPFVINPSGRVFVGNTTASDLPDYSGTIRSPQLVVEGEGYATTSVGIVANVGANSGGATFSLAKSRGTNAAPNSIVASGDSLGAINFDGNDGTAFVRAASISANADGTPGTNDMPGRLIFSTTADGASAPTERMRIDSSGNVLNKSIGGLGYGTGSGGAVTQITSRTTGVTLDKTNGAITLVSAAGSATYQSFTVTNSKVAATDTIILNQKSGTDKYILLVTAVAAGSFEITYATTGGTTTETPVINFAVIKAVTS